MAVIGQHPDGSAVRSVVISAHGLTAEVMSHGGTLRRLAPDGGRSVVLGFDDFDDYLTRGRYFGAIVGRYANRIAGARAMIAGREYQLDANYLDRHLLHGGRDGSGVRNWQIEDATEDSVTLSDHLPDGHMGFPGAMQVTLTYRIIEGPALEIEISARADAPTLCNFAQHGYFNLTGAADIADHHLRVAAQHYLPVDDDLIPTGAVHDVQGTRFDFLRPTRLGDRLDQGLIDHNLCLSRDRQACRPVAWLTAPGAACDLRIETTEPGLQVYAGAHLGHAGLAMEPQLWPDAPHQPDFPDALLQPDDRYHQITRLVLTEKP